MLKNAEDTFVEDEIIDEESNELYCAACGHLVTGKAFHKFYFELGEAGGEPASASTIVEPRYRVFGDAAVVTYVRLQQRGRTTTRTEETRVWRRCDSASDAALGRWRLVHFHRSVPQNAYG